MHWGGKILPGITRHLGYESLAANKEGFGEGVAPPSTPGGGLVSPL